MLRTRLLSINMTSVNGLNKTEPFDSLRYDAPGMSFISSSAHLSNAVYGKKVLGLMIKVYIKLQLVSSVVDINIPTLTW